MINTDYDLHCSLKVFYTEVVTIPFFENLLFTFTEGEGNSIYLPIFFNLCASPLRCRAKHQYVPGSDARGKYK